MSLSIFIWISINVLGVAIGMINNSKTRKRSEKLIEFAYQDGYEKGAVSNSFKPEQNEAKEYAQSIVKK